MKKTFKDIAHHYLRSGLMVKVDDKYDPNPIKMTSLSNLENENVTTTPIMYDMADIDKEITHNGETFVPLVEIFKKRYFEIYGIDFDGNVEIVSDDFTPALKASENCYNYGFTVGEDLELYLSANGEFLEFNPIPVFLQLIEWHFNCFSISDFINKREHEG